MAALGARLPLLLGGLLAALLLLLSPDPDALEAQGLARLLRAPPGGSEPLAALAKASGGGPIGLRIERRGDGQRLDQRPAYRRAFESALNVENARRRERGELPLELAGSASRELVLELERDGARLALHAALKTPRGLRALASSDPVQLPDRSALLPPLVAILVALAFRRTVSALFAGIWIGAALLRLDAGSPTWLAVPLGLWDLFVVYLWGEITSTFRIEIIGFVTALMALVGVMSRGGGLHAMVARIARFARDVRGTLLSTFGMGLAIFFDDYSNCLIVGNTMRPLTDRFRISREKLAYVVDSTAAPVAGISLLSTWVAFEVSTFGPQLPAAGITESPYLVFLQSLPFRFYCLFTLGFVALNAWMGRDFGPMRAAEARARTGALVRPGATPLAASGQSELEPSTALPQRARHALLPLLTVVAVTIEEIFRDGGGYALLADAPERLLGSGGWLDLLANGAGAGPLFVGAVAGLGVALFLLGSPALRSALAAAAAVAMVGPLLAPALAQRPWVLGASALAAAALVGPIARRWLSASERPHLRADELARAGLASTRGLSFAVVILFEAWMIGRVCQDIATADYLVALATGLVSALWLPALLFGIACLVSFSTGTSWGTMAILLPNVVGLAAAVGAGHAIGPFGLVLVCIGAVLEGAIFGDHCSPISDTTILSSLATASDHIDHVRTQAPYALLTAGTAVLAGYLPTMLFDFWSLPLALGSGFLALYAVLRLFGRPAPE